MSLCAFSGTIVSGAGALLQYAQVTFDLRGPGGAYDSINQLVQRVRLTATTNGSGVFSQNVVRTDQLTPSGMYWQVECKAAGLKKYITSAGSSIDVITAADIITQDVVFTAITDPAATYLRYTSGQTLTAAQKLIVNTSIGLNLTASQLLGQAASGGTGLPVAITIGTGLSITGTTLNASGGTVTIGSTPIASGTTTRVLFDAAGFVGESSLLTFNSGTGILTATGFAGALNGDASTATLAASATALATGHTIAMTGDVVWTSPSFDGTGNVTAAGTIQAGTVTLSKMANLATSKLIGRITAGTGIPEAIGVGTGLQLGGGNLIVNRTQDAMILTGTTTFGTTAAAGVIQVYAGTGAAPINYISSSATALRLNYFPDVSGTFITDAGAQALTNKTYNGNTWTAGTGTITITGSVTLTVAGAASIVGTFSAAGKTLTVSNNLTFAGTDGTTMTFPATNASVARIDAAQSFAGIQTFTTAVTTGTTTASAEVFTLNSVTTGTGIYVSSTGLTAGKLIDIQVSGTGAIAGQVALNVATAGANAAGAITTKGGIIANTHTGTTSTNIALELTASGGATANTALNITAGKLVSADATDASSSTAGSVQLAGGLAVAKKLYVGTGLNIAGGKTITKVLSGTYTTSGETASIPTVGGGTYVISIPVAGATVDDFAVINSFPTFYGYGAIQSIACSAGFVHITYTGTDVNTDGWADGKVFRAIVFQVT